MTTLMQHLKERHFNLSLYPSTCVSESDNTATFYLWNLAGQMVGYQQYTPFKPKNDNSLKPSELRYFTYLTKTEHAQTNTAFGLELLDPKRKLLFVVEGVFDVVRLHNLGLNALAVLGCNPKQMKNWLWSLGYVVVPVCEGDKAGQKLSKLANTDLVLRLDDGVDLGDMKDEDVLKLFKKYL